MKEMQTTYNPKEFEDRIYADWMAGEYFRAEIDPGKAPFTVMMPPPNITGRLHMGHAMDETMQDTIARFKRMQGYSVLWLPGTDHASLATEHKIAEKLREEGVTKEEVGREKFLRRAWEWKEQYGGAIIGQLKKLGCSCDWSRLAFTMDEKCSKAVREAFFRLYQKGLIYRGSRIINWCPDCQTALSDEEVTYSEDKGSFWYFKYPVKDSDEFITIATTRPETMLGDTAVAVNPADPRYSSLVGKTLVLPLVGREIPIIADSYVDMEFGTGAVKITPAHDPNDFEVGLRHNLPMIRILNDDGTVNAEGGKYCGLGRYEARDRIVAEMESLGLLVRTEPHVHNVGHCHRCLSTIEPIVSKQWFVKMAPLAKPAIDAVAKNNTKFIPDRFAKIYFNWLENIRDWCISRQLWWGHRIPVWYCSCGEVICARETPAVCPKCGGADLKQDEDCLDTWFSSALWPFSTLGWPEKTPEFDYFYPTDVLVTGYDIIPFWVMRMMFSGLEHTGKVPFRDVLIHGLVRDEQGRKMSKSLGNGIDPLEIIDKYGADSLRLSLLTGVAPGNDTRFTDTKAEWARNFINKVWNASRFVLMNAKGEKIPSFEEVRKKLQPADRWIISRLMSTIREVTLSMQRYDLGIAADRLTDFMWEDFCDWYIELSKSALYGEDPERKRCTLSVLLFVLDNSLRLLHPFIPFVTEEIYGYLPTAVGKIIVADYPRYDTRLSYKKEAKAFEAIIELIKAVRAIKVSVNCPPAKKVHLFLVTEQKRLVGANKNAIRRLAGVSEIEFIASGAAAGEKTVSQVLEVGHLFVPLGELVDFEEERARLQKELDRVEGEIARAGGKLANNSFIAKAPKKVVDDERAKLEKYIDMKRKIEKQLEEL